LPLKRNPTPKGLVRVLSLGIVSERGGKRKLLGVARKGVRTDRVPERHSFFCKGDPPSPLPTAPRGEEGREESRLQIDP